MHDGTMVQIADKMDFHVCPHLKLLHWKYTSREIGDISLLVRITALLAQCGHLMRILLVMFLSFDHAFNGVTRPCE